MREREIRFTRAESILYGRPRSVVNLASPPGIPRRIIPARRLRDFEPKRRKPRPCRVIHSGETRAV